LKSFGAVAAGALFPFGADSNQRPTQPDKKLAVTIAVTRRPAGREALRLCAYFIFESRRGLPLDRPMRLINAHAGDIMVNPTMVCLGSAPVGLQVTSVTFLPQAQSQQIRGYRSVAA
jgi:hypothetical protein